MLSESSSRKPIKILGAVLAAVAIVVVGVVALSSSNSPAVVDRAQAIAKAQLENANVPLAKLPEESEVNGPKGWQVESDEPMGTEELEENPEKLEQEALAEDEEIDSPLDVEEDENGEKYVAETDEDVIITSADDLAEEEEKEQEEGKVAADGARSGGKGKGKLKCFAGLKKCGFRNRCQRVCTRKCNPYATRVCKSRKFCKCFCKFQGNIPKARKCVVYKKTNCKKVTKYNCKRTCKKYCKKAPRCYCCQKRHVMRQCKKLCKKISYKTKCGKCRCYRLKCYKWCRFVCKKKYTK